ncbi:hypothetical protein ACSMXM_08860 [Pacificimonas sp. ICDLI1SI03]
MFDPENAPPTSVIVPDRAVQAEVDPSLKLSTTVADAWVETVIAAMAIIDW